MTNAPQHPGLVLRNLLDERGISQSRAAEALGITRQHLNSIINGHNPISAELKFKLQDYLNVPPAHWNRLQEQQAAFAASPEGQRYLAETQQAEFLEYLDMHQRLHLVDHEIESAVRCKWLGIEPSDPFETELLSATGYWLTLGLRGSVTAMHAQGNEQEVLLKPAYDLPPRHVLTVLTHEKLTLPPRLEASLATEEAFFCSPQLSLKCARHWEAGLDSRIALHIINESSVPQTLRHRQQAILLKFTYQPVAPARQPGQ